MEIKQKWALVDWQTVCRPKRDGGFGLRDSKTTNKVLSGKIWWQWVTHKGELFSRFWHHKYARGWSSQNLICFDQETLGSPIWQEANANK